MEKLLVTIIFFVLSTLNLLSITIVYGNESHDFTFQEIKKFKHHEIQTEREKKGEFKKEKWVGATLKDILTKFSIKEFEKLQVIASDNYMVRFDFDEITETEPIIAYSVNGKDLEEKNFRLIAPQKRDMFWIRDISGFKVEYKNELQNPEIVFIAERILQKKPIQKEPEPFKNVSGYFLKELFETVFPLQTGEYLIIGKDGVRHTLDYNDYLSKSVLIHENGKYDFKSPQMPAGMWLKEIAYMQKDEIGVLFINQFTNWHDLQKLLNWDNCPDIVTIYSNGNSRKIKPDELFEQEIKTIEKIEW